MPPTTTASSGQQPGKSGRKKGRRARLIVLVLVLALSFGYVDDLGRAVYSTKLDNYSDSFNPTYLPVLLRSVLPPRVLITPPAITALLPPSVVHTATIIMPPTTAAYPRHRHCHTADIGETGGLGDHPDTSHYAGEGPLS